jgi:hypothetical protein
MKSSSNQSTVGCSYSYKSSSRKVATQNVQHQHNTKDEINANGSSYSKSPPQIVVNERTVERVTLFNLLGVVIANNLDWDEHVTNTHATVNERLHFLSLLKRSSVTDDDLMQ